MRLHAGLGGGSRVDLDEIDVPYPSMASTT
jgi:hypothetical protein